MGRPIRFPRRGIRGLNAQFFCVQAHFSPDLRSLSCRKEQVPHAHEVIGSRREGENPSDFKQPAQSGLAQHPHGFQPAEHLFDSLPLALADRVSGMARGASINRASTAALHILRHVRRHIHGPHIGHQITCVISLVGGQRDSAHTLDALGHQERRIPFRRPAALLQFGVHHQPVAVLDQKIAAVCQLRLMPTALARQSRLRIRLRFVRVVTALLAVKVDGRIAWIIRRRGFAPVFSLKALLARPRPDQCSIHAEVFVRCQTCGFRLFQHPRRRTFPPRRRASAVPGFC